MEEVKAGWAEDRCMMHVMPGLRNSAVRPRISHFRINRINPGMCRGTIYCAGIASSPDQT
jgi:hypothetical protein